MLSKKLKENSMRSGRLERTSNIRTLSPYMDDAGVIRSQYRISVATFVAYDTGFPVILPKEHEVIRLLLLVTNTNTRWVFNPPARLVRSAKSVRLET